MAPEETAEVKTAFKLAQTVVDPKIELGLLGIVPLGLTDNVLKGLLPQSLLAFTEMVPEIEPATTEIVFVVLFPVQPFGKVQV